MLRSLQTLFVTVLLAGGSASAGPPRNAKSLEPRLDPESGNGLYKSYCASCHGLTGRGDGPAADAFRMRPTDLTRLTHKAKGVFPAAQLLRMLGGSDALPAHGGRQMPVWGPTLAAPGANDSQSLRRLRSLIGYIESMQDKVK